MAEKTKGNAGKPTRTQKAGGMSKKELMRQAISHLGKDAKPLQIQSHVKDRFGVEISTDHISAAKTQILREMAQGAKPAPSTAAPRPAAPQPMANETIAPKPAAKKPVHQRSAAKTTTTPKPAPLATTSGHAAGNGKSAGGISMEDIRATSDLLGRVGAVQLRELIAVLAK